MVYEGINKEGVHALGLATSEDGVKWERKGNEPIFERSPPGRRERNFLAAELKTPRLDFLRCWLFALSRDV